MIGSVHFSGNGTSRIPASCTAGKAAMSIEVYERYYDAVRKAAETGFYDFIGHIDVDQAVRLPAGGRCDANWRSGARRRGTSTAWPSS